MPSKNFIFFLCMYKMVDISAKIWNKAKVSVMKIQENNNVNKTVLLLLCIFDTKKDGAAKIFMTWLIKKLKENVGLKTCDLAKQQIRKYKIDRAIMIKGSKHSMYVHEDILIPMIMQRLSAPKTIRSSLDLI